MQVVIRYLQATNRWYVCHAKSYQNAIGSTLNGRTSRAAAVALAESMGMTVTHHPDDPLQKITPEGMG